MASLPAVHQKAPAWYQITTKIQSVARTRQIVGNLFSGQLIVPTQGGPCTNIMAYSAAREKTRGFGHRKRYTITVSGAQGNPKEFPARF